MLNHQLATRDTKMPQEHSSMGGWHLASVYPQPCINDDIKVGEWLRSCQRARQLAQNVDAQPYDPDAQIQDAPENPLSEAFDFHSPGYFATKKSVTIHPSPTEKEEKYP
jgi:hypothetical protein